MRVPNRRDYSLSRATAANPIRLHPHPGPFSRTEEGGARHRLREPRRPVVVKALAPPPLRSGPSGDDAGPTRRGLAMGFEAAIRRLAPLSDWGAWRFPIWLFGR